MSTSHRSQEVANYISHLGKNDFCPIPMIFPLSWSLQHLMDTNCATIQLQHACGYLGNAANHLVFFISIGSHLLIHAKGSIQVPKSLKVPGAPAMLCCPAMVVDPEGTILLVYLPGVFESYWMVCSAQSGNSPTLIYFCRVTSPGQLNLGLINWIITKAQNTTNLSRRLAMFLPSCLG